MEQPLCKLTLVYPPSANDRILEVMLRLEPPLAGFTTWTAEGHGFGFATASTSEQVRGRVKRAVLLAVLPRSDLQGVLRAIATHVPIPHLTYWVEPVEQFAQLSTTQAASAI